MFRIVRRFLILAVMVGATAAGVGVGFGVTGAQADVLPAANPGGPYSATVGQTIQFSGAANSGVALGFVWSFGDGTTATGAVVQHAYAAAGVYTVTLTATDAFGRTSTATTTATISNTSSGASSCWVLSSGQIACANIVTTNTVVSPASLPGSCYLTATGYVCANGATYAYGTSAAYGTACAALGVCYPYGSAVPSAVINYGAGLTPYVTNGTPACTTAASSAICRLLDQP